MKLDFFGDYRFEYHCLQSSNLIYLNHQFPIIISTILVSKSPVSDIISSWAMINDFFVCPQLDLPDEGAYSNSLFFFKQYAYFYFLIFQSSIAIRYIIPNFNTFRLEKKNPLPTCLCPTPWVGFGKINTLFRVSLDYKLPVSNIISALFVVCMLIISL